MGGEDRIDEQASSWGDSFIVNLGTPETEGAPSPDPKDLTNWHVDGDFFVHFLVAVTSLGRIDVAGAYNIAIGSGEVQRFSDTIEIWKG